MVSKNSLTLAALALAFAGLGAAAALAQGLNLPHLRPPGEARTTQQNGQVSQVEPGPDGGTVYTHGHRFPDNTQTVTQHHDARGVLRSAQVTWSGFAGQVLDVTATFDAQGRFVKEEGYRAPEMKTAVTELIRPLPAASAPTAQPAATSFPAPQNQPTTGADAVAPPSSTAKEPTLPGEKEGQALPYKPSDGS